MREVLTHFRDQIESSDVLDRLGLKPGGYFLVSAHREENVDDLDRMKMLLECLTRVYQVFGLSVVVSTHPRTRKRLEALQQPVEAGGIRWLYPFGFHEYNKLQIEAACVLSDSGTISEESSILGFKAVTLRDSIERPEALDSGAIIMTGLDMDDVERGVRMTISEEGAATVLPAGYEVTNTSARVVRFLLSTCSRHSQWSGLR